MSNSSLCDNSTSNDEQNKTYVLVTPINYDEPHKGTYIVILSYNSSDMSRDEFEQKVNNSVDDLDRTKHVKVLGMYDTLDEANEAMHDILHGKIRLYTQSLRDGILDFPELSKLNYPIYPYIYITLLGYALEDYHCGNATIRIRVDNYLKLSDMLEHIDVTYRLATDEEMEYRIMTEIHDLKFECNPLMAMFKRQDGFSMTNAETGERIHSLCGGCDDEHCDNDDDVSTVQDNDSVNNDSDEENSENYN